MEIVLIGSGNLVSRQPTVALVALSLRKNTYKGVSNLCNMRILGYIRNIDCRRPLLVEDCQHYGRTCASLMAYCASFMMHNDAQCDFGNFEALADF